VAASTNFAAVQRQLFNSGEFVSTGKSIEEGMHSKFPWVSLAQWIYIMLIEYLLFCIRHVTCRTWWRDGDLTVACRPAFLVASRESLAGLLCYLLRALRSRTEAEQSVRFHDVPASKRHGQWVLYRRIDRDHAQW
jgi:hypothetical protein